MVKKITAKQAKTLKAWRQAVEHVGKNYSSGEFIPVPKKGTKAYRETVAAFNKILKGTHTGSSDGSSGKNKKK